MSKKRRRDTTLTIRLTKAEKERIERNAKRTERSITDYPLFGVLSFFANSNTQIKIGEQISM